MTDIHFLSAENPLFQIIDFLSELIDQNIMHFIHDYYYYY